MLLVDIVVTIDLSFLDMNFLEIPCTTKVSRSLSNSSSRITPVLVVGLSTSLDLEAS